MSHVCCRWRLHRAGRVPLRLRQQAGRHPAAGPRQGFQEDCREWRSHEVTPIIYVFCHILCFNFLAHAMCRVLPWHGVFAVTILGSLIWCLFYVYVYSIVAARRTILIVLLVLQSSIIRTSTPYVHYYEHQYITQLQGVPINGINFGVCRTRYQQLFAQFLGDTDPTCDGCFLFGPLPLVK